MQTHHVVGRIEQGKRICADKLTIILKLNWERNSTKRMRLCPEEFDGEDKKRELSWMEFFYSDGVKSRLPILPLFSRRTLPKAEVAPA